MSLVPHLFNGLTLGLLFALVALGFMLIVGVMETINLAHGSLFALGMYAALAVITPRLGWLPEWQANYMSLPAGTRYALALFVAPVLVGVFGLLLELCLRRTYGRDPLYGLLLTFGAALVIEEAIRLVWGSTEKQLPLPEALSGAVLMGDLIYSRYRLFACGFAVVAIVALWLFLEKTPYGAIIKAGAHDSEMVRALGINLARLRDGADLGHPAAGGRRCRRTGVPGDRARRRRFAVGGSCRRLDGGHGRRAVRRIRIGVVDAVDVPAVHRCHHLPRARAVWPQEHPGQLT
jgi:branched-chain amino acid transport system permease protein